MVCCCRCRSRATLRWSSATPAPAGPPSTRASTSWATPSCAVWARENGLLPAAETAELLERGRGATARGVRGPSLRPHLP